MLSWPVLVLYYLVRTRQKARTRNRRAREAEASANVKRVPELSISGGRQSSQLQDRPDHFAEHGARYQVRAIEETAAKLDG
jgi:hypothetical protein